jgi:hypothetical protein
MYTQLQRISVFAPLLSQHQTISIPNCLSTQSRSQASDTPQKHKSHTNHSHMRALLPQRCCCAHCQRTQCCMQSELCVTIYCCCCCWCHCVHRSILTWCHSSAAPAAAAVCISCSQLLLQHLIRCQCCQHQRHLHSRHLRSGHLCAHRSWRGHPCQAHS